MMLSVFITVFISIVTVTETKKPKKYFIILSKNILLNMAL